MRRVLRKELDKKTAGYLTKRQSDANKKSSAKNLKPDVHWKSSRQTAAIKTGFTCLQSMMGPRQRCMYCVDSHGCDIEHFWPKDNFPERLYQWKNLLLCCTECGRFKGNKFPLSENQQPMLLDPSIDEPWQYLDFDPDTGNITARFDLATNTYQTKGEKTVEVLHLDEREALAAGYKKTYVRLIKILTQFMPMPISAGSADTLIIKLIEDDDHGLLGWFFKGNGKTTEPVLIQLQTNYPLVFAQCIEAFQFR
jgi:uncharacterized protein (TIGR02646 family)